MITLGLQVCLHVVSLDVGASSMDDCFAVLLIHCKYKLYNLVCM